jgi:diguanylate cyclase (GGDEF)-like protein
MASSWLCRDDMDRARLLDMEQRLRPVRAVAIGVLALALLAAAPWIGLWTLVPLVFAAGLFEFAHRRLDRAERPEFLMFAAWAGSEVTIAAAVAIAGGPHVATLSWLAIPVVTLSSRFSISGVYAGVGIALALLYAVAFIGDAQEVIDDPVLVFAPTSLIIAIAVLSTALMRSDVENRGAAVVDPLTGMLNRKALSDRAAEVAEQSEVTGQPVGLIIADVDHFKKVNDSHGHQAGDIVLKEAAYVMRKQLRAFDLVYRIGGEEFVVLLPGAGLEEGVEIAEVLRSTIEETRFTGGHEVRMSFGVAASRSGTRFEHQTVFNAADRALYEAKKAGRNRVRSAAPVAGNGASVNAEEPAFARS